MQLTKAPSKTMSSREISELTGKQHKDVLHDIRKMLDGLGKTSAEFSADLPDSYGRPQPCFILPKDETICLMAGYDVKARMVIIKRWQELESKQGFEIPSTLSGALMLAAKQAEQIEQLSIKAQADAPKIEFAMAVRRMEGSCQIGEFCKTLRIGRTTFFKMLRADKVLMENNLPYQQYIDRELFVVIEQIPFTDSSGKSHPVFTTMVTGKGQVWLERKYRVQEPEGKAA
jgi:anti-repressor protein